MSRPETQTECWKDIKDNLTGTRREVLDRISEVPQGKTLFELVETLGWPINRISGRVTELHQKDAIVDSGDRRINPSSGRRCVVWKSKA